MSAAGTVVSDSVTSAAKDSKIGIAFDELELAHTLPGPNYNWTATDYADCLAAKTIG